MRRPNWNLLWIGLCAIIAAVMFGFEIVHALHRRSVWGIIASGVGGLLWIVLTVRFVSEYRTPRN